jgi:hypothetical protein
MCLFFWCCDLRYDFCLKIPPIVCRSPHVLFTLFVYAYA